MAIDIPFKILEIHVFSAQYLPPVSKMLRTFAVAWINPDHKLSTRIDHHGHTNPTWNYKLVFRVEDRFLRSDRATLTVEIYNVAWLRDLPVGTAHLMINQISPPLVLNSPTIRTVSLNICRPSGHMQGVLNIGVNILDNGNPLCSILSPRELCALRIGNDQDQDQVEEININNGRSSIDEKMKLLEDEFSKAKAANKSEKGSLLRNNNNNNNDHSDLNCRTKSVGSTAASQMKPLPSEVAANLKKGFYSTATGDEYGSSIFDNWTEETDNEKREEFLRSRRNAMLRNDIHDQNHQLIIDHDHQESNKQRIKPKRRSRSDGGGGLFSCFGKGFEFTLICGNSNMKRKRKGTLYPRTTPYRFSYPEDDLRRFYA